MTVMAGTPDRLADEGDVTAAALAEGVELGVTVMEEGTPPIRILTRCN